MPGQSEPIQSPKNPIIRHARRVGEGRVHGVFVAEGVRLVEEAADAGLRFDTVLVSPKLYATERGRSLAQRLEANGIAARDCADEVLERASSLTTHQGILALVHAPEWSDEALLRGPAPFLVVAAGIRDPGNLGAVMRAAEAAGASGFVVLENSAHPFRDKAVRAAAGSAFRLPIRHGVRPDAFAELVERHGIHLLATDSKHGRAIWEHDFGPPPQAFVLGSEAAGIPDVLRERCEHLLRIPMREPVESLNVAVAAGLVLFEHRRRLDDTRSDRGR